eukprot:8843238-Pyramimonas_sp.AAC.1
MRGSGEGGRSLTERFLRTRHGGDPPTQGGGGGEALHFKLAISALGVVVARSSSRGAEGAKPYIS